MAYTPKNPNGSATSANSSPVVIASDQSAVPVTVSGVATAANQTTLIGHVDGIETLIGTTNTTLTTIDGRVDGLETLVTATNTKLDTVITQTDGIEGLLTTIDADTGSILTSVDGIEATLTTIEGDTSAIQTAVQLLDDAIFTDDAAFTKGTSKGIVIEGVAVTMDGTDPGSVSAENDAAAVLADPNRILLVNQTHPRFFRASVDYASAQTNATVVAAPGAGLSLWITDVVISNGATAGKIQLLDGSGGSAILTDYPGINGGLTETGKRTPYKLTANTALCVTSTTVTTHSVTVTGYIAA